MLINEVAWEDPDVVAFKREQHLEDEDSSDDEDDLETRNAQELQTRDSNAKMNRSLASVKPIIPTVNAAGGPKSGRRPDGGRAMTRKI